MLGREGKLSGRNSEGRDNSRIRLSATKGAEVTVTPCWLALTDRRLSLTGRIKDVRCKFRSSGSARGHVGPFYDVVNKFIRVYR